MKSWMWEKKGSFASLIFLTLCGRLVSNLFVGLGSIAAPPYPDLIPLGNSAPAPVVETKAPFMTASRRLMTTLSGCHMTKWIVVHPIRIRNQKGLPTNRDDLPKTEVFPFREYDCLEVPEERRLVNLTLLSEGDTVYIPLKKLQRFILEGKLDQVQVPIVIISGQAQLTKNAPVAEHIGTMLAHPMVIAWFCQNLDVYATTYLYHPKVHPWPYGLPDTPFRHQYSNRQIYRRAITESAFLTPSDKNVALYLVYFTVYNNWKSRLGVPNGNETKSLADYYGNIARARFIFSPNGDRPECYRHYEAIGLGTVPVTQLDPHAHRHLNSSVVFQNDNWNLSYWSSSQALKEHSSVTPNRELIFEDYWIEYAQSQVGRRFRWATDDRSTV